MRLRKRHLELPSTVPGRQSAAQRAIPSENRATELWKRRGNASVTAVEVAGSWKDCELISLAIHTAVCILVSMTNTLHRFEAESPEHDERILHLLDVENLIGSPTFGFENALTIRRMYTAVAPAGSVDQVVLATSHHSALAAWFAWPPSARRLLRSGPDGADLALLDVLAFERAESRFDRVVIGSGDGIFSLASARLQEAGCAVTVVTRRDCLSRQLRLAVRDVRFLDAFPAAALGAVSLGDVA
jgi:hypothetical protein